VGYGRGLDGGVEVGSSLPVTLIYFPSYGTSADTRPPEPLEVGAFDMLETVDEQRFVTGSLHEVSYVAVKPIFPSKADEVPGTQICPLGNFFFYLVNVSHRIHIIQSDSKNGRPFWTCHTWSGREDLNLRPPEPH
jgi:hypothetical protein